MCGLDYLCPTERGVFPLLTLLGETALKVSDSVRSPLPFQSRENGRVVLFILYLYWKYTATFIVELRHTLYIMDTIYMTEQGYQKLLDEIKKLETEERPDVIRRIAEARDKGDLSENAEYAAAKEAQQLLESRINNLKEQLSNARMVDTSQLSTDSVQILNKVKIKNLSTKKSMTYTIVSDTESDLKSGKIAISTPIAQGLLGKKVGDEVEIQVPNGMVKFLIEEISF